ncbi:MAG: methionyl-tRNA formyltransferase [Burkholderiales bacterium]
MRLVFAGTPPFAERALHALLNAGHEVTLVVTQPDRPAGRGMRSAESAVKQFARKHALDVYQPHGMKDAQSLSPVVAAGAELLVVAAYGLILPQAVLDSARHGALNIHASLLPRWRGAAPIQRAILAGDRETGVTIMKMDAGLDTGPMLAQRAVPISEDDDAGTLHDKLAALGAEMIVAAVADVAAGTARFTPQPSDGITYAHKIEKRESTLDWQCAARDLARAVRAFRPVPGAATTFGGETLKVWRAREVEGTGAPGEVLRADEREIVIACGAGALAVSELQRAGGRRLSAADFLRGQPIAPGALFGALRQS